MAFKIIKNRSDFPLSGDIRKEGRLVTNSINSDQIILSHRTGLNEILNIKAFSFKSRLVNFSTTPEFLGNWSIEIRPGNKILTLRSTNNSRQLPPPLNYQITEFFDEPSIYVLEESIPIPPNTIVRFVCTPSSNTGMIWIAKILGTKQ